MNPTHNNNYRFNISLSVLNHLGRNLYRSFITVLGEAISNAWDADARNVWINIDREHSIFSIKDDGSGMDDDDFQNKFLKIGYSKRADGSTETKNSRPYIGAKGIGKLALLSCARRISIFSKTGESDYVGGVIDNNSLDQAITEDLEPSQYSLENLNFRLIEELRVNHGQGTIIVFEKTKDRIKNTIPYIRKLLAMSFRFSLIDKNFSIFVNGREVTISDLNDLIDSTEFLWVMNEHRDEYVDRLREREINFVNIAPPRNIKGFLATVVKPRYLKITDTDERATIDLFVNGRLREKNILRHIPTQRILESYLYGQVHFDSMDQSGADDPFTSSREGIVEDDENFQLLLQYLKSEAIPKILDEWDKLRLNRGKEGDPENPRKSIKERKALDLYSAVRKEYELDDSGPKKTQVDDWLNELRPDAAFNLEAYSNCFLSENLVRKYITEYDLSTDTQSSEIEKWKTREAKTKEKAKISYDIKSDTSDLGYLGMDRLSLIVEGKENTPLWVYAVGYKPIRNALSHTALLSSIAKDDLKVKFENIKARVKDLISSKPEK